MIHFAPNVYVLQYLSRLGHTDEEMHTKALNYMTQGMLVFFFVVCSLALFLYTASIKDNMVLKVNE